MRAACRAARALLLPLLLLLAACGDPRIPQVARDADAYVRGVQYRDALGLIKYQAVFREAIATHPREEWEVLRERSEQEAQRRFAQYDEAKVTGALPVAPDGIDLIQGLAIGKGIFYSLGEPHLEEEGETATAVMTVRPDYAPHRFDGLPPGTRVYLMGEPLGALHTVTVGGEPAEQTLRVVGEIRLEWRFRWFDGMDVYPGAWAVESIRPVPGGVGFTELRRVF